MTDSPESQYDKNIELMQAAIDGYAQQVEVLTQRLRIAEAQPEPKIVRGRLGNADIELGLECLIGEKNLARYKNQIIKSWLQSSEGVKARNKAAQKMYKNSRAVCYGSGEEKDVFFEVFPCADDNGDIEEGVGHSYSLRDAVKNSFGAVINWELRVGLVEALADFDRIKAESPPEPR